MAVKFKIHPHLYRPTGVAKTGEVVRVLDGKLAKHGGVRAQVRAGAESRAQKARTNLARARYSGNARVRVKRGKLDWYVQLVDPPTARGRGDVLGIEYGRKGSDDPRKWHVVVGANGQRFVVGRSRTRPTWVLHDAAGLPHK